MFEPYEVTRRRVAENDEAPGEPASALDYLQDIYKGRRQVDPVRMRAASIALPFEKPKLTAIATSSMDGASFAAMLDRAIERSKTPPKVIEHRSEETAEGIAWTGPLRGSES